MSQQLSGKKMAEMTPYDIAEHYGCHFSGDMNPIDHGGTFYNTKHWEGWGYADVVNIFHCEGHVYIEQGTVNKPTDMEACFRSSGVSEDNRDNVHAQIDAVKGHWGVESGGTIKFKHEDWDDLDYVLDEAKVWLRIRDWIKDLDN